MPRTGKKTVDMGTNSFVITMSYPKQVMAGNTIVVGAEFLHRVDGWVNPSSLTCKVYEGLQQSGSLIATLSPVQDPERGTGFYVANFNPSITQATGPLSVFWSGSYTPSNMPGPVAISVWCVVRVINPSGKVQ